MIVANLIATDETLGFSGLSRISSDVANEGIAVGVGIKVDAEATVVGSIGGGVRLRNLIVPDE